MSSKRRRKHPRRQLTQWRARNRLRRQQKARAGRAGGLLSQLAVAPYGGDSDAGSQARRGQKHLLAGRKCASRGVGAHQRFGLGAGGRRPVHFAAPRCHHLCLNSSWRLEEKRGRERELGQNEPISMGRGRTDLQQSQCRPDKPISFPLGWEQREGESFFFSENHHIHGVLC